MEKQPEHLEFEGFQQDDQKYFYCGILTKEQEKLIRHREMKIYSTDGLTLFKTTDGNYAFYVMFK